jgi:hypothetical protein
VGPVYVTYYRVYYRADAGDPWILFSTYTDEDTAVEAKEDLEEREYEAIVV